MWYIIRWTIIKFTPEEKCPYNHIVQLLYVTISMLQFWINNFITYQLLHIRAYLLSLKGSEGVQHHKHEIGFPIKANHGLQKTNKQKSLSKCINVF